MAYMNSLIDGARTAFMIGLALAISNGLWQRTLGKGKTLSQSTASQLGKVNL